RHTRFSRDWSSDCALPIYKHFGPGVLAVSVEVGPPLAELRALVTGDVLQLGQLGRAREVGAEHGRRDHGGDGEPEHRGAERRHDLHDPIDRVRGPWRSLSRGYVTPPRFSLPIWMVNRSSSSPLSSTPSNRK